MKVFIVLCALIAIIRASPAGIPAFYTAEAPILTQYHSQDELGQYSYGYNGGLSAKVETKSIDGVTRGSYSYVDADGFLQTVEYTADALNGFRAAATNLPQAPINNAIAPEPVKDTPEVAQARADHMAAFNEAALRSASVDDSVETIAAPIVPQVTAPIAQLTPINTGNFVAFRTAEYPQGSFSYQINSPAYAYTTRNFYPNAPYYTFGAPLLRAAPLEIRPASPVEIRPAAGEINPFVLRTPTETPEVAQARAEHLAAVEKERARIATTN